VTKLVLLPITHAQARKCVQAWHSHHRPHLGEKFAIGGHVDGELVAAVVVGRPVAPTLQKDPALLEVTRLAVGPAASPHAASRLLGASWRAVEAMGVTRFVSYTRVDERGTCYLAAGWLPVELVKGRPHTTGNRQLRWLPGLREDSTEVIDRVRWEIGPRAQKTRVYYVNGVWQREPAPRPCTVIEETRLGG
jgi:hypothetical protein